MARRDDDSPITSQREREAGRLLDDGFDDDEAMAVAEVADYDDDAIQTAEEAAMHLTDPPSFDDSDGYVDED